LGTELQAASELRQNSRALALRNFISALSLWKLLNLDAHLGQKLERVPDAVVECIEYLADIAEIDEAFGALDAGKVSDESQLLHSAGSIAVDDRILFAVEAAAVSRFRAVTAVREAGGITVVAHG
jgi:hypothetical protein